MSIKECVRIDKTRVCVKKIWTWVGTFHACRSKSHQKISIDPFLYFSMWIYNLMYCGSYSSSKQYIRNPYVIIYERDTNMIIVISIYHRRRFHTYIGLYKLMSQTFHEYQRMRPDRRNQDLRNKDLDLGWYLSCMQSQMSSKDINRSVLIFLNVDI